MAMEYTKAQRAVIENRGGGLLVSAAAGSGKTSVLVDRLLDQVEKEGRNIDAFLIITFTKAAAEELRSRIFRTLNKKIREQPENLHLRKQTMLLYHTQISTIHALCTIVLREWGHMIDVPGDFTLCNEEDAGILMLQTLEDVLEARYEVISEEGEFAQLLDILSAGRDDRKLVDIVLDVYSRMQSHPDPIQWMEEQRPLFYLEGVSDAGETLWGRILLEDTRKAAGYWSEEMERAMRLTRQDEALAAYAESLAITLEELQALTKATGEGWDAVCDCAVTFPRLKAVRNCEDQRAQEQIKAIRTKCKEAVEKLKGRFESHSRELLEDIRMIAPAMMGLFDLVAEFTAAYDKAKAKRGLLDFSDLEHKTVALLVDEKGAPTEIARALGSRFAEIMVDEYQDTNQVQNTIFDAISQNGQNLFMVGDVKQSIYRFRLADPTIFLEKYRRFLPYEEAEAGQPRKILLSQNFRSRPEVLEAVNDLFRSLMSEELGEMNYTDEEALYAGGSFPEGDGYETELHILDFKALAEAEDSGQRPGNHELEARFVAGQIAYLLEQGFPVSDGEGGKRPATAEDVAILLRAPGSVRHFYTKALKEWNLPWAAEEDGSLFETTEVETLLSLLQIIDNPRQDVPLISVLHSPLFGFDGERLAEIRQQALGEDLYTALRAGAEVGLEGCEAFVRQLEDLRFEAGEMSCHALLWNLYQETRAVEIFRRMPNGAQREENLMTLYELACRFEANGHRGLFGFLHHLEKMKEAGLSVSTGGGGAQKGIQILSIHRSKGLEYPIVFLCGLGKRFNLGDVQKPVLFHPKLGLGPRGLDIERMVEFQTLPRQAVSLQLKREMLAEEMRLLYVAMTRAKEKLIMTNALSFGVSDLAKLAPYASTPIDPNVLMGCSSVGQWILLAAMARPEGAELRGLAGDPLVMDDHAAQIQWKVRYHTDLPVQTGLREEDTTRTAEAGGIEDGSEEDIWKKLTWRYAYEGLAAIPAKLTATQLSDEFAPELRPADFHIPGREPIAEKIAFHRPRFAAEALGLTPSQRGTAYHTALQSISFDRVDSVARIERELQRLVEDAYMTAQEAQAVDAGKLFDFFQTDLGAELRKARMLHREFPFSILVPAGTYYEGMPEEETVLLQGVIDCWFETEEGITLLDFKSNQVTVKEAQEKAKTYEKQLSAYAYALEEMTGSKVTRKIIWFLGPNCGVELGISRGEKKT